MHYLLVYEVGDDYVSKRAQFRELHLEKAWEASERGALASVPALEGIPILWPYGAIRPLYGQCEDGSHRGVRMVGSSAWRRHLGSFGFFPRLAR